MLPSTPSMERRSITSCDTSANIAPLSAAVHRPPTSYRTYALTYVRSPTKLSHHRESFTLPPRGEEAAALANGVERPGQNAAVVRRGGCGADEQ